MIAIIDYGAGNIKSVEKACEYLGHETVLTRDPVVIKNSDRVILPGDGNFGFAMDRIDAFELRDVISEVINDGKPFLGICLGLQILYEESEESPGVKGLGLIKGKVLEFNRESNLKIPEIGWNSLKKTGDSAILRNVEDGSFVYFVHTYFGRADDRSSVAAVSEYADVYDAVLEKDNLFACQFHPEKSGRTGLKILENFLSFV